mgnify:CR=1 FL=1
MISKIFADGINEYKFLDSIKDRSDDITFDVNKIVNDIIIDIKNRKDTALKEYTEKFDKVKIDDFAVSEKEIEEAFKNVSEEYINILKEAAENIEDFHKRQKTQSFINTKENNVILGQRVRGLEKVGIYVPGGTAAYPSSVLMNAIPAKVAGVKEIIMVTPPLKDGSINKNILAAAKIAGVTKIYKAGGAQAIAALAFGTESIEKVDKIVGPGNIFVATAKKNLFGIVDIDMVAGPSEILIIADKTANPKFLAADMMSQAEHDVLASSILVVTDEKIADETICELEKQSKTLEREEIIKKSLKDFGAIIIAKDVNQAIKIANYVAPEHLEVVTENPITYLGQLDNAGSIFLGSYSPEPIGDYFAGPNHVLPTGKTAKFFSPLSVDSFVKRSSFIYYSEEALQKDGEKVIKFANSEGLTAHANSVKVRLK